MTEPALYSATIEELADPGGDNEHWREVQDHWAADAIARLFGFPGTVDNRIGGWMIEVTAEDQVQAIEEGGYLVIGGNDAEHRYRITIELP